MKTIIWVLAFDEAEAAEWARDRRLSAPEWRYAHDAEELRLAVPGDTFSWVGRVRQRADYIPMAGLVRAKKMQWWRS